MALSEDDLPNGNKMAGNFARLNPLYWEKQHNELTKLISKVRMGARLIEGSQITSELRNKESLATSEAAKAQVREQMKAVDEIVQFNAGMSREIMEKVLDRDSVSNEEASELVAELRQVSKNFEKIADVSSVDKGELRDLQTDQMYDTRLSGDRKSEILRNYLSSVNADSPISRSIMDTLGVGDSSMDSASRMKLLNGEKGRKSVSKSLSKVKTADTIQGLMVQMNEQMAVQRDQSEKLSQLSSAITDEKSSDTELKSSLDSLVSDLKGTGGSSDSMQGLVSELEVASNMDNLNRQQLSDIVNRMNADTTQERTLFTLSQINDNLEDGLMKDDDMLQALEANNLSDAFMSQAEKIAVGNRGLIGDLIGGGLATAGLGGLSELLDPMDAVDSVMDSLKSRRQRKRGARGGRGGRSGGRRGIGATVGGFFKAGAGKAGGLATGAAGMLGLGDMSGMMGTLGKLGGVLKTFAKVAGPAAAVIFAAFDAFSGWNDASSILGKAEEDLTMLDKAYSATLSILSGFSFGLVSPEELNSFFTEWGGKISEGISGAFDWVVDTLSSGVDKLMSWVTNIGDTMDSALSWMTDTSDETITSLSSGWEATKSTVEMVYNAPMAVMTTAADKMEDFLSGTIFGDLFSDSDSDVTTVDTPTLDAVVMKDHGESSASKILNSGGSMSSAANQLSRKSDEADRQVASRGSSRPVSSTPARSGTSSGGLAAGGGSTKAATTFNDFGLAILAQQVF
ncbi:hypothetical protein NVP1031O_168 [Vibrio phage 1.031.O._10N.261.46.F8]|nr:hypothetical protein NVP1031O_168 [Vibrio phage 1.031.O._10N.261.46.F8]